MHPDAIKVAVAVVKDARGRILVNRRPADAGFMPGYWEFPGGKLERGEDAWQALVRELKEELAIAVLGGKPLMVLEYGYPDRHVRLEVWQVTEYTGWPVPQEGQQVDWCEPRQLEQLRLLPADGPIVTRLLELAET